MKTETKIPDGKRLRNGGDYVAVDIYKNGVIHRTSIYLTKGKSMRLAWMDRKSGLWMPATVVFNGQSLDCRDKDGMEWQSDVVELLTEARAI